MDLQNGFHSRRQPIERNVSVGRFHAVSRTVPRVDRSMGVKEKHGERQIEVELEHRQIQLVTFDQSHANELLAEFPDFFVATNNLLVECLAGLTGYTAAPPSVAFRTPAPP